MNSKPFNFLPQFNSRNRLASTVKHGFLTALLTGLVTLTAFGQVTRNWTGADSGNWSDPNNWSPAGIPQTGDALQFGFVNDGNRTMTNDVHDVTVQSLSFVENNYQLGGQAIAVQNGIYNNNEFFSFASETISIDCTLRFLNGGGGIYTGGVNGLLTQTTDDLVLSGSIFVETGTLFLVAQATDFQGGGNGHLYISGVIDGSCDVFAEADEQGGNVSEVQFDGVTHNTFAGTLYLSMRGNAQMVFNNSVGAVAPNSLAVTDGSVVNLQLSGGPQQIGNVAAVTITDGSTLALSGNNVTVGSIILTNVSADADPSTLDTGSILVGLNYGITASSDNEAVHPIIKGRINLNGLLPFNVTDTIDPGLEIQATIEGVGFDKTGAGLLLLDGNNTFTGNLQIDGGTVEPSSAGALSPSSAGVILNGGSLELIGLAIGSEPLQVNATNGTFIAYNSCSWAGPVTLNATLKVLPTDLTESGQVMNFSGPISGVGGMTLEDNPLIPGNAEFSGSAANTFSGPVLVQCQTLYLDKPFDVQAFAGPLTVGSGPSGICEVIWSNSFQASGTTLTLFTNGVVNLNNFNENFNQVTFNGGKIESGTGQFGMVQPLTVNPAGVTAFIAGNLGLISASPELFNVTGGFTSTGIDLQVNAAVIGTAPQLVKKGGGTMSLAGPNTSAATTILQDGILAMDNGTALGIKPVVISSGTTLKMDVIATLNQSFELAGDGTSGLNGALDVAPGISVTLNGPMLLDAETTINVGQASGLVITGVISGTGPLTEIGLGEIELAGSSANTYSGDTFVNQGTLALAKSSGATAAPGNLTIGTITPSHTAGTSAIVGCVGNAEVGAANVTVNGGSLFELAGNNQTLVNVNLNSGGSISTGGGTLTLTGGNTADVVAVAPGKNGASVISGNLLLSDGGTFAVGSTTQFNLGAVPVLDVQAALSDGQPAGITKNGAGEMRLSSGNSFTSPMVVSAGKLTLANSFALGNAVTIAITSNSQLALEGGISIQNVSLTLDTSASPAWQSINGTNFWNGNVILSQTAAVDIEPTNGYLGSQNVFSGPGGITAVGLGTLDFEGSLANTYAGLTTVSNGLVEGGRFIIKVTTNPGTGRKTTNQVGVISFPGDVVIGSDATSNTVATLRFLGKSQNAQTANVAVHRSGLLDLSPVAGQTVLSTLTGSGPVNLGSSTTLFLVNTSPFTFYGDINGSGDLIKNGSGTMTTYGDVNTTGSVQLLGGDWELFGARHNGGITVTSGGASTGLGGDGLVDGGVTLTGASLSVDSHFPDHQGSTLTVGSLSLSAGDTVQLDMFGPSPTGGNDQIATTSGGVSLSSDTTLSASFSYPPRAGDVINLISVPSGQTITGNFANFPDGIVTMVGNTPVLPSYEGGSSGHDFTLTVTNLALAYVGYQLAEGNGNQTVEPNECNLLYVSLVNRSASAVTITNAYLRATNTTGVIVTIPMASYPVIAAGQTMTNLTPFQFSTDTNLPCGGAVGFELVVGVVNEGQFAIDFNPISGGDCSHPTGPCDSCTIVSGQFATNTPVDSQPLYFVGAPSICFPPKAYPGTNPAPVLASAPYLTHNFTNSTTNLLCVTAELEFDCPSAPTNALGVAAYLGAFDPNNPATNYLGDIGAGGPPYPAFSFQVPPGTNFTLVVMAQATNLICNNYTLQLFGLPCPAPTLVITNDTAPAALKLNWSTAYPGFTPQQSGKLAAGTFTNVTQSAVILNSRYSITNLHPATNQFYRLKK